MNAKVLIQSRLSSSRLPAKALLPLQGMPSIVLCALRAGNRGRTITIATSLHPDDDLIVNALNQYQIPYFRGSLEDVLFRFVAATNELLLEDIVIRLTGDNIYPDGHLIDEALDAFITNEADYLTTMFPGSPVPYGLSIEIFRANLLREANSYATTEHEREHVTPWIARNCKRPIYFVPLELKKSSLGHLRCTLDHYNDYIHIQNVFCGIDDPINIQWSFLIEKLRASSFSSLNGFPTRVKNSEGHAEFTLGTAQLGLPYGINNDVGMPSESEANEILLKARMFGVTALDTARGYGIAEERLGKLLESSSHPFKIITKLDPLNNIEDLKDNNAVCQAVELSTLRSCHALGKKTLDTLLLHRWELRFTHNQCVWKKLLALKKKGMINELGASLETVSQALEALDDPDIKHIQIPFNILDWRWLNKKFIKKLSDRSDVIVHIRSSLLQGLILSNKRWPNIDEKTYHEITIKIDYFVKKFQRKNRIDLCYAYIRSFPWVSSIVIGIEKHQQLIENLEYFQYTSLSIEQSLEIQNSFTFVPENLLDPSRWEISQ